MHRASVDMGAVHDTLSALSALDAMLTGMEKSFDDHYPGMMVLAAFAAPDPEVVSQLDVLTKAREGLKSAKALLGNVNAIIVQYPEDKTAARALTDANTMIDRFTRHEANAAKVIRTMATKRMPPGLEKLADQAEKLIKKRMVDPKKLTLIPWLGVVSTSVETSPASGDPMSRWYEPAKVEWVKVVQFSVVFSIRDPGIPKIREHAPSNAAADEARVTASENSLGKAGQFMSGDSYNSKPATAQGIVDLLVQQIDAWEGWKGGAEIMSGRMAIAPKIKAALEAAAKKISGGGYFGGGVDTLEAEISRDGKTIDISFRTDLRGEDYGQYDEDWSRQGRAAYSPHFERALAPFAEFIEKPHYNPISYGEKGWWSYSVNLK